MTGQQAMKYVPFLLLALITLLIISTGIQIARSFTRTPTAVTVYVCDPECHIDSTR